MFSCDIAATRPLTGNVTVKLTDIPSGVGAVALFCNENEWKAANVNGTAFVTNVNDKGEASFVLEGYTLATPLKFQFTPMPSMSTSLGDDWWSYALSGSAQYANEENNMICNFLTRGINSSCTITVSKESFTSTGGNWSPFPIYGVDSTRQFNENFRTCYTVSF
jgi:hypothetical protein